jgi:protein-tyrosine phosphatase
MGSARLVYQNLTVGPQKEAHPPPEGTGALLNVAEEHPLPATDLPAHKVPITDMNPIPVGQLEETVLWIDAHIGKRRIYLFCNAGVGRSPSVAVAYLCCYRGFSFGEAVEHVARRKPDTWAFPG